MNISVFCSEKFYIGAKIMITSFLVHNNFEKHNIFIISTDLEQNKIDKLNKFISKRFGQKVNLLKISDEMKSGFPEKGLFSAAGFHKLYAFNYLPIKINRIMCLDADALVLKSLKNFYYQDMEDNVFIASEDCHIRDDLEHLDELGLPRNEPYFNLGCIVIDLEKYLKKYSEKDYLEWMEKNGDKAKYVAQDVINVLYKGSIKLADYKIYNNQIFCYEDVSNEEMENIERESCVIHSIGPVKPWNFRYETKLNKFTYNLMKKNGMIKEYGIIMLKKKMFRLKYRILNRLKGE